MTYAVAEPEDRYRLAAAADVKTDVVRALIATHAEDQILIIGQYLDQLEALAEELDAR